MAPNYPNAPTRTASRVPAGTVTSGVTHVNVEDTGPSVEVGEHLARHPELSLLAIGLAVHIRSLPDGSPIRIKVPMG